ncbi:MAG TPA: class I tRNA ligase family protein, partial [Bacilli bacterium]|nr:class I tRNA ligase family protein [Bacilli bacterium]
LACIAPFIGEEIYESLGHSEGITFAKWPTCDESKLVRFQVTMAVSVNGKLRGTFEADLDTPEDELKKLALDLEGVRRNTEGKEIVKIIIVRGRIINIVVR